MREIAYLDTQHIIATCQFEPNRCGGWWSLKLKKCARVSLLQNNLFCAFILFYPITYIARSINDTVHSSEARGFPCRSEPSRWVELSTTEALLQHTRKRDVMITPISKCESISTNELSSTMTAPWLNRKEDFFKFSTPTVNSASFAASSRSDFDLTVLFNLGIICSVRFISRLV